MKGKAILSIVSLLICAASVAIYFTKQSGGITVRADASVPKIAMFGYEFYRFKDDLAVSRLAGEKAELFDGGRVELSEGVRGVRINGVRREELTAKRTQIQLAASNQGSLSNFDKINKIHVFENVDLMLGEAHVQTEDATYTEDDATIRSTVPVHMDQTGQDLNGAHGFEFNVKAESLKMTGGVSGTIMPASIRATTPKGVKK